LRIYSNLMPSSCAIPDDGAHAIIHEPRLDGPFDGIADVADGVCSVAKSAWNQ
jgi:hypothetical protein